MPFKLELELAVLLVVMVYAWRKTTAKHMAQGRGIVAARIGGLGAAITAFAVIAGLIFMFDPPPFMIGKVAQPTPAPSTPTVDIAPQKTQ